jgi:hypothetical protein
VKRKSALLITSMLTVVLAACSAGTSPSGSSTGSTAAPAVDPDPSGAVAAGTPGGNPSALQLAAGMLKLEGTSNAVSAQEAAQLLPLWQSLQQIESTASTPAVATGTPGPRFDPALFQQVAAQVQSIENAMPPAQIQAIATMNLSRQDIGTVFQQADIPFGGPGEGGFGFGPNASGGTFTPPQRTPRPQGTPGAYSGNRSNFNGGRQGFGDFVPPTVIDAMVQFLEQKAGS